MEINIQIGTATRNIQVPTSWNELHPVQAMTILSVIQLSNASLTDKRLSILRHLLALSDEELAAWQDDRKQEYGDDGLLVFHNELLELLHLTDFMLEENEDGGYQLSPTLTKNLVPEIGEVPARKVRNKLKTQSSKLKTPKTITWYGPADELANITGKELAYCFDAYERYSQERDLKYVHKIIAILYRPGKKSTAANIEENFHGDRRKPLNMATVAWRTDLVAKLPVNLKNLLFFHFMSCRIQFINQYQNVFKTETGEERQGNDYGWWGTFRAIAGNLKDIEAVADMSAPNLLAELSYLEDQRKQLEMQS